MLRRLWRESLSRLLYVAVKHKQPIGVAIGIGEVELLALAKLDPKVLVLVVHLEGFQIAQRRGERIVLVGSLVSNAVGGGHQSPLTRAHAMFVDDSERCVESTSRNRNVEVARAWLNVDGLRDSVESFGGHVHLVGARLHVLCGQRCRSNELPIDEDLRLRHVGIDSQRARFERGLRDGRCLARMTLASPLAQRDAVLLRACQAMRCGDAARGAVEAGAAAGFSGSTLVRRELRITSRPITNAKQKAATARTRRFTCRFYVSDASTRMREGLFGLE